jgi:hypothetical protein
MLNRLHTLTLALILGASGCSITDPSSMALPEGAEPMAAPPEYQAWFSRTEACSGIAGKFNSLEWYVVKGVAAFQTDAGPKVGMWEKVGGVNRIIVAGNYREHEMVVRHEILHALLDREGHPAEYFVNKCQLTWETWHGGQELGSSGVQAQ